eukprot:CAMPEP_0172457674 /NCGR_PEP_ID=MMETSP1065-20121228/23437_1 /TAXON_ID=265537 /ORGANISM="Amphiprora paludosa, Strain CCMP125" /LENGTH=68 /DNA_ID=CAMNT_0013211537 /DNA_START=47 /DNA_END=249 /DNA_ORIENTATION=+
MVEIPHCWAICMIRFIVQSGAGVGLELETEALEGDLVGDAVGEVVGDRVGLLVGEVVGEVVGLVVGEV